MNVTEQIVTPPQGDKQDSAETGGKTARRTQAAPLYFQVTNPVTEL